jgi:hypothetical protein
MNNQIGWRQLQNKKEQKEWREAVIGGIILVPTMYIIIILFSML